MVQLLWRTVWRFLKKFKNRSTVRSSNSTSGYIHKRTESRDSKRDVHTHDCCSIIHNSKKVKATQGSTNASMDKQNGVYT